MKIKLFTIICLSCIMSVIFLTSCRKAAETDEIKGLTYTFKEIKLESGKVKGMVVTACDYEISDSLTILPKVGKYDVVGIDNSVFKGKKGLQEIKFPDSLKWIGDSAFESCSALKDFIFPTGLESLGEASFRSCESLVFLEIPDTVTCIGSEAFRFCYELKSVSLPASLKIIEEGLFSDCGNLERIKLPQCLDGIQDRAFYWTRNLKEINFPDSLKTIGNRAFASCSMLKELSLPGSLESIGDQAFFECTSLSSVQMADSVTLIGKGAFQKCNHLVSIRLSSGLKTIGEAAFVDCTDLKSMDLPQGLVSIGPAAFSGTGFLSLIVPDSVTELGEKAFLNCDGLERVKLGAGLTRIEAQAFSKCSSLVQVEFSQKLEVIGENAFSYCKELSDLSLFPQTLSEIGDYGFTDCIKLTNVLLPQKITKIGTCAFKGCINMTGDLVFTDDSLEIGASAFKNCENLTSIKFPAGLRAIESNTFENCYNLSVVNIPGNLGLIGDRAFENCKSLPDELRFTGNLGEIGFCAFNTDTLIKSFSINRLSPPRIDPKSFNGVFGVALHIPAGSKEYYNRYPWNDSDIFSTVIDDLVLDNNLKPLPSQLYNVRSVEGLNLRDTPSVSAKSLGTISYGDNVWLMDDGKKWTRKSDGYYDFTELNWSMVIWKGIVGWVYSAYLCKYEILALSEIKAITPSVESISRTWYELVPFAAEEYKLDFENIYEGMPEAYPTIYKQDGTYSYSGFEYSEHATWKLVGNMIYESGEAGFRDPGSYERNYTLSLYQTKRGEFVMEQIWTKNGEEPIIIYLVSPRIEK